MDMSLSTHQETVKESAAWRAAVRGVTESLTRLIEQPQQNTGEAAIAVGFRIWKEMLKTHLGHLRLPDGAVILRRAYVL